VNGVFLWGAQYEVSDFGATDYIPTTTAAVSVGPVANVPRLDYTNSSCPRLLLEPQRTNLVVQSNFLNLWSRFQNTTKSFDSAVLDPAGNPSSRYLRNSSSTALASRDGVSILANTTYTFTYYARKGNYSAQLVEVGFGTSNVRVTYNFDSNTFSSSTAGTQTLLSTSAQSVGNGWVRIAVAFTGSLTTVNCAFLIGNAVNDFVCIYGTQLEAGAYATSYIPTLSASVTRVADAASKTGISSLIGQSEGTLFINPTLIHTTTDNEYLIQVRQSNSTRIFIYREATTNKIGCFALIGASTIYTALTAGAVTGTFKAAFAYKSGSFAFYVNGTQVGTSTATFTTPALTEFFIDQNNGIENGFHAYNQALLFKTRLTNSQLSELTSL
jgi:hypothetical protein